MSFNLPGGAPELKTAVERFVRQIFAFPLRLWRVATAELPAAADYEGGLVWDATADVVKWSDGSAWVQPSLSTHGHAASAISFAPTGGVAATNVQAAIAELDTEKLPASYLDTDGTLAANSDARIASQKATRTYVDALLAAQDAMVFKGVINCSANPNYPAADRGHTYRVSVAGKIGGASGPNVEAGDILLCLTDGTSAGTHAAAGAQWSLIQVNLDGAVIGPASSVNNRVAVFSGTSGKVIADSGLLLSGSNTGDQTSIAGITGTKAQFNSANTDGDFVFTSEVGIGGVAFAITGTTRYIPSDNVEFGTGLTNVTGTGGIWYHPFSRRATITHLAIEVTTAGAAGATARLALYKADGVRGGPGTLIQDLGNGRGGQCRDQRAGARILAGFDGAGVVRAVDERHRHPAWRHGRQFPVAPARRQRHAAGPGAQPHRAPGRGGLWSLSGHCPRTDRSEHGQPPGGGQTGELRRAGVTFEWSGVR